MKRLLNTLYITSGNRYLSLDGENVVVMEDKKEIGRIPLHNLQAIVTFGYTGASPALMGACAQRNIELSFMSGNGRFLARVSGEEKGNVTLRKTQYRISEKKEESVKIAKNFILGRSIMPGGCSREPPEITVCGWMQNCLRKNQLFWGRV